MIFFNEMKNYISDLYKFYIFSEKKTDDNIINLLLMYYNVIVYVKDAEFLSHDKIITKIKNKDGIDLIHTDLPSIESCVKVW